ncbi:hypothetical protein [Dendronalium sp. ChiSLP03b]
MRLTLQLPVRLDYQGKLRTLIKKSSIIRTEEPYLFSVAGFNPSLLDY